MPTDREKLEAKRQEMVETIIAEMELHPQEWSSGWHASSRWPENGSTSKKYRGLNALYLWALGEQKQYGDSRWVTFNQAKELGASVKKGEKSATILFFEYYDRLTKKAYDRSAVENMTDDERKQYIKENVYAVAKYSQVFNAAQCVNFPTKEVYEMSDEERAKQNETIERIIANSGAPVLYDGGIRAYYAPGEDKIHLPEIKDFDSMQDYYATALHEIAHSTGAPSRLDRNISGGFGSVEYAVEELRAELACMFLQAENGIALQGKHISNHAAYLDSWLKVAHDDKTVFAGAVKDAVKISDYITDNYANKEIVESIAITSLSNETTHVSVADSVSDSTKKTPVATTQQEIAEEIVFNREMPFAAQVDAVLNGEMPRNTAVMISHATPLSLRLFGLSNLPMLITQNHVKKAVAEEDEKKHTHGLDIEQVKSLPDYLAEPTIVLDGDDKKNPNRIVVVSNNLDHKGRPIIVAIEPDGKGRYYSVEIDSNFVTSLYGRNNFENYIATAIEEDRVLFWDKEKTQTVYREAQLQLPRALYNVESDTIIRKARAFVNTNSQKTLDDTKENQTAEEAKGAIAKSASQDGNKVHLRMRDDEMEIFKEFLDSFQDGANGRREVLDFGVNRPQSADFWTGLAYLGEVTQSDTGYSVEFDRSGINVNFQIDNDMSPADELTKENPLQGSLKAFYTKNYPTDDLGQEIDDEATFAGLEQAIRNGENVYDFMGVHDSVVRERLYAELANHLGVSIKELYKQWQESSMPLPATEAVAPKEKVVVNADIAKWKNVKSPMVQEYMAAKELYPNSIVAYRMGDFYEFFGPDAKLTSEELELTLTGRKVEGSEERIEMTGIPVHAMDKYLDKLLGRGHDVVIIEDDHSFVKFDAFQQNESVTQEKNIPLQEVVQESAAAEKVAATATHAPMSNTAVATSRGKWQTIVIPAELCQKEHKETYIVTLPKTSKYKGFAFFYPKKLMQKQEDGTFLLAYDSTKQTTFKALNDGREAVLSVDMLNKILAGEDVPYEAKRVRAGKEAQRMVEQTLLNIPQEMQQQDRWCVHSKHYEWNEEKQRRDVKKEIFDVHKIDEANGDGKSNYAKCNDSTTWTSIESATHAINTSKKYLVGLTYVVGDGISVVDLDHCFNSAGEPTPMAKDLLSAFEGTTYIEKSMSGTGLHIFVKGDLRDNGKYSNQKKGEGGEADIEVYDQNKFMSVTGNIIGTMRELGVATASQKLAVQKYLNAVSQSNVNSGANSQKRHISHGYITDDDVVAKIRNSKTGAEFDSLYSGQIPAGKSHSDADYRLLGIIAFFAVDQDKNQIRRIFESSALFRPQKQKYLDHTIDSVLSKLTRPTKDLWANSNAASKNKESKGK